MKKISLIGFVILVSFTKIFAQNDSIETLKQKLSGESIDSLKIELMLQIGGQYQFIKPDSAIYYFRQALELSDKSGFKSKSLLLNQRIARFMMDHGNYTESLRLSNQNIKQAQELKDTIKMWYAIRLILWLYRDLNDNNNAMKYADQLLLLTKSTTIERSSDVAGFKEMSNRYKANVFTALHRDDSALNYYSRSLRYAGISRDRLYLALSSAAMGDFYFGKEKYDSAFYYYRLSIPLAVQNLRTDIKIGSQIGMAKMFLKQMKLDSALANSKQVINDANLLHDSASMSDASFLLSDIFKKQNRPDSAYKYLQYAVTLKKYLDQRQEEKNVREALFKQTLQQQQAEQEKNEAEQRLKSNVKIYSLIGGLFVLLLITFLFYRNSKQKQKDALKIQESYDRLKATQQQLIQSEKMASLGELTAGIAHEIQNPLNFVNNFSEVNKELVDELKSELATGNLQQANEIADDIKENSEKINHHGKRADAIVKGMLQHSRSSSGVKEPTDINALCDEYLRLSYHGLRAKDKSFNATIKTDFDTSIDNINIIPQDIGRVVLNLINNAFYVVDEKKILRQAQDDSYEPTVTVSTKRRNGKVEISVADNGNGIQDSIKEKIFQPFFTTKPTGQGTGLGLSLSYDIIKAHGGEIKVNSKESEGTEFIVVLPIS